MGVFGLTSYISKNSDTFLKDYKLHNCRVLIDGNAAASLVYSNLTKSNHAFGGDYDKYVFSIIEFIQLLKKCLVYPIFIFDGGYEIRKLKTVIERIKLNIMICGQYKNKYRESKCFPILMRDVFRNTLKKHGIPVIQCDFEADQELVILSRILNCPVISNDSDFYLSDAWYIPFTSIEFKSFRFKTKKKRDKYYVKCKIFNVDEFLNAFGGISDKSFLPLISCILGNDYIAPNTFKEFLNITYRTKFDDKIRIILKWIKEIMCSPIDLAINQVISCIDIKIRNKTKKIIEGLIFDYNRNSSTLLEYISNNTSIKNLNHLFSSVVSNTNSNKLMCDTYIINNSRLTDEHLADDHKNMTNNLAFTDFSNINFGKPIFHSHDIETSVNLPELDSIHETTSSMSNLTIDNFSDINGQDSVYNETNKTRKVSNFIQDEILVNNDVFVINASSIEVDMPIYNEYTTDDTFDETILHENETLNRNEEYFIENEDDEEDIIEIDSYDYIIPNSDIENVPDESDSITYNKTEEITLIEDAEIKRLPNWFQDKFRSGLIPPTIVNVINFRRIFIPSQSEDYYAKPSHEISLPILQIIIGIVLGNVKTEIKCHARMKGIHIGVYKLAPVCDISNLQLPKFKTLENLNVERRKIILLKCLNIQENVNLTFFPEDCQLFIIILFYWSKNCKNPIANENHIRAIIVCFIYLNIIDVKLGFIRSCKALNELHKSEINNLDSEKKIICNKNDQLDDCNIDTKNMQTENEKFVLVSDYLNLVSKTDCLVAANALLHYHEVDNNLLRNRRQFDVKLVHSFAQFQHCILSIMLLNSVLNFPFVQCEPNLIFSGTFLYNFYSEMFNRKLSDGYITRTLLSKSGGIILLYRRLINMWEKFSPNEQIKNKKKRKTKNKIRKFMPKNLENEDKDTSLYADPNNIYSLLMSGELLQ